MLHAAIKSRRRLPEGGDRTRRAKWRSFYLYVGAMLAVDGTTRTGSVLIINVPTREDAERFSANEPFRKAGLFTRVEINRMRRGQWNPAAAPKTAEGNCKEGT